MNYFFLKIDFYLKNFFFFTLAPTPSLFLLCFYRYTYLQVKE